ncbi:hypothetical protein [uncultured Acidaminococcus sp.]|nr:hypothetical protein [uncultured Acidaminococcus sp.]
MQSEERGRWPNPTTVLTDGPLPLAGDGQKQAGVPVVEFLRH